VAVKDFIKYYNEEEAQYNEMLGDAKDLEQSYREGHISDEQYDASIKYIEAIRTNHERLSYVAFLLTKRKKYLKKSSGERLEVKENAEQLEKLNSLKKGS